MKKNYSEEITIEKKCTFWRVYYRWGSRLKKTKPMTSEECLKHFKKCYAVIQVDETEF